MTEIEFRNQFERLRHRHPTHFNSKEMFDTTWDYVRDLKADWFRRLVDRIILAPDPRNSKCDIGEAAIGERRAKRSVEFANDVARASQALHDHMTEKGLDENLKKLNANSLWDAVQKSRASS